MIKPVIFCHPKNFNQRVRQSAHPAKPDSSSFFFPFYSFDFTPVGSSDAAIIHIGLTFLTSSPSCYNSYLPLFNVKCSLDVFESSWPKATKDAFEARHLVAWGLIVSLTQLSRVAN